ncbi:hypothetical protein ACFW9L_22570 [Streptomyces sp. NPDC059517]|uniref:hypothetical protein n=1 Tax=Streptomyces sp. NPDC059517 TaxID=3346855 RepID=UPI003690B245
MARISVVHDSTEWRKNFELRLRAADTTSGRAAAAAERGFQDVSTGSDDRPLAEITDTGTRVGPSHTK